MVVCSRFIILQSVVTRYLFVQKVVNCCTISCTLKIFSTGLNSQAHYKVPLIMTTGTDEFSLYTRTDSYFSPSVKDGSIFTDPEKHKEFAFAKTYGSRLYELFNAEESAVTMFNHYGKAPIYTMKIACGNNPKLVGEKTAFTSGSIHGIWIPFATGIPTATTVVSRFFRKFISSASKYRNQIYGFSSSFGCSISILNRCSMSI